MRPIQLFSVISAMVLTAARPPKAMASRETNLDQISGLRFGDQTAQQPGTGAYPCSYQGRIGTCQDNPQRGTVIFRPSEETPKKDSVTPAAIGGLAKPTVTPNSEGKQGLIGDLSPIGYLQQTGECRQIGNQVFEKFTLQIPFTESSKGKGYQGVVLQPIGRQPDPLRNNTVFSCETGKILYRLSK